MGSPSVKAKIVEPFAMGGNKVIAFKQVAGPAAYTTGGDEVLAKDFGLTWIVAAFVSVAESGDRILYPLLESADLVSKFKCLITSLAGVEVANASDQSAKNFRITVIGVY